MPDALYVTNEDGGVIFVNSAGRRLFGLQGGAEASGLHSELRLFDLQGRELAVEDWPDARSLRGEAISNFEVTVQQRGRAEWIGSFSACSLRDGSKGRATAIVTVRDVTHARVQELRETGAAWRSILDASPLAIITLSTSGLVKLWNRSAERITGYSEQEVAGRPCPFTIEYSNGVHDCEMRLSRSDGMEIEVFCSSAPLWGLGGEPLGRVVMFSDMTERIRMNRRIENTQRLESLGALAGGVAHDFNNLLTGIMGNASLSLYSLDDDSEARPLLEEIVRSSERAAALTRQLLAYAGKGRTNPVKLRLADLAEETVKLSLAEDPVHVHFELDRGLPEITADPVQIRQVVTSLITNAREAIGNESAGQIRVTTRLETLAEPPAHAFEGGESPAPGRYAVLEVADNGSGMEEATRARIFEPFFSTKFTGRGLGLSSVLGIVRQHNGALQVETMPGAGSTFRVLLPITPEAESPRAASTPYRELEGEGLILVVDDEDTVRRPVRRALERLNYQVVLAENGQAAVEAFSQIAGDVRAVILDLTMPVMGGQEALGHLQRIRPGVPVILTSGYSEAEAMRRMGGKAVAAFLQKPFDPEQVGRKLRDLLRKRAAREVTA